MTLDNTLKRFRLITGLSDEEISKWLPVLKDSMIYVEKLVTKTELSEYDVRRLDNAAAVYAYYRYVSYSVGEENSFSAGEISVTVNKDRIKEAEHVWNTELETIGDLVNTGFIFKRVQ